MQPHCQHAAFLLPQRAVERLQLTVEVAALDGVKIYHGKRPQAAAHHRLRRPAADAANAAQQRRRRALPDLLAVVEALGYGNARLRLGRYGVCRPKVLYLLQQRRVDALVPQLLPNIHNLAPFLLLMPYYTPTRR